MREWMPDDEVKQERQDVWKVKLEAYALGVLIILPVATAVVTLLK